MEVSSDYRTTEAMRRQEVLTTYAALLEQGLNPSAAARQLRESRSTIWRWQQAYKTDGFDGLKPNFHKRGRHPLFRVDEEQKKVLQQLFLKTNSVALAVDLFADHPACDESLSLWLKSRQETHRIPPSLRRACHVIDELQHKFRGPRKYDLNSINTLRDMTEILPSGERVQVQPGDWWEMDDMSSNHPFWYEVPAETEGKRDRLAQRFGAALGRQSLLALDVASGKWLGFSLIGRPRDAYRAEDILRFIRMLMEQWGKPRRGIRLERGIWRSKRIKGYVLKGEEAVEEERERGAMDEHEKEQLFGGLQALGIEVQWVWTPKQKSFVEGGFNFFQSVLGVLDETNIGRYRGEFERATKSLVAVNAGSTHPKLRGFVHINVLAQKWQAALTWMNGRRKEGRLVSGIPDDNWQAATGTRPLATLESQELWVFLPETRELQVRHGHVAPHIKGLGTLAFCDPELFAQVGNGYRVLVRFDPSEPQLGAAVFNREPVHNPGNVCGWRDGEHIGHAAFIPSAPQFCGADGWDDGGAMEARRRYRDYHQSAFRAIGVSGRKAVQVAESRDGRGNVSRIESGVQIQGRTKAELEVKPARRERPVRVVDEDDFEALRRDRVMEADRDDYAVSMEELEQM